MVVDHREKAFETAIEEHLTTRGGYVKAAAANFDPDKGIDASVLLAFLRDSQPKEWKRLEAIYGGEVEFKVVSTILGDLDRRGTLDVLRKGVTDRGVKLRLAYFKPASGLNPETLTLYGKNVLTVARQVHFSRKDPNKSVDLLLSLNGLPVATAELKSHLTGQTVEDAQRQYRTDRDPSETLFRFKTRALVHFAVDPDEVYMTTRLAKDGTLFLPFNKGVNKGAGNPDNPGGYKTAYLWEEIWARDSWMEVIGRFIHLEVVEDKAKGRATRKESLIFPRFQQLDVVRKMVAHAKAHGAGRNYLAQHSAGSGKSNSIAWLAHQLSSLHDDADKLVFDSVIVITDRRNLDKQLQDTVYQFEHKQGVVVPIDKDSAQLGQALSSGAKIVITTLQKFPFVIEKIGTLPSRKYAVIVDEAHSSQSGEAAAELRRALSGATAAETTAPDGDEEADEPDIEDEILKYISARGRQSNLSYFAFTATPKYKTLKFFDEPGPDGKPPFHLYSMRQAIEEKFILDVLAHYTTYKTYFNLTKRIEDDPNVDRKKAVQAIARYVSLHPHNLAQKTEVMIEHFRHFSRQKIGGRAKAMVVTRSRLQAVKYKQEFDKYLREKNYADIKALVAFSGTVTDDYGNSFTEPSINGFGEKQLPAKFATDEYQVLLVAEKYQTGFDQPLLHTMYVDKKLKGLHAVQTLSRLNRTHPGKVDTFVLDFVNDAEEIRKAFKPYYEQTEIDREVDPNQLYTLKNKLDNFQIYWWQEVEDFAAVFFKPGQGARAQGLLHKHLDPAVGRFKAADGPTQDEFRHDLSSFLRLYSFLAQLVDFQDADLEKLYAYGRMLLTKLPRREGEGVFLDDEVALSYYKLSKTSEGAITLQPGDKEPVSGPSALGTGEVRPPTVEPLSQIIDVLNDTFGTDFKPEDKLLFDQVMGDLSRDEELTEQAQTNTIDQYKYAFEPKALEAFITRMQRNQGISSQFMNNPEFRALVMDWMMQELFNRSQSSPEE